MKLSPSVIALAIGFVIVSYYVSSASGIDGKKFEISAGENLPVHGRLLPGAKLPSHIDTLHRTHDTPTRD